jgi:hypothetical protein
VAASTSLTPEQRTQRARVAALSRSRTPDDPDLVDARQQLSIAKLADHIQAVVDAAPPLTEDQKARLRALLGGAGEA